MSEAAYSNEDLELFTDLDRAARALGFSPCLIGAGAIQLGSDASWEVRLNRATKDWDFVVRVDSWEEYEAFAAALTSGDGGFTRSPIQHRFHHRAGRQLDVVPFGGLENPPGKLAWPVGGCVMDTRGLTALEKHHEIVSLDEVVLRVASIPAILGLKLLAYGDRRPGIVRDIQDVHNLLLEAEQVVREERISSEALDRLGDEQVGYGEVAAYILGRDVAATFPPDVLAPIQALLDLAGRPGDKTVGDVLKSNGMASLGREQILLRLRAFHLGTTDGRP